MDVIAETEYDDVYHPHTHPVQVTVNEDEAELQVALRRCSTEHVSIDAAIIEGKYKMWIEFLEEKHKRFERIIYNDETGMNTFDKDELSDLKIEWAHLKGVGDL